MRRYERLTFLLAILAMASLVFASGCGGCDDDDQPDARIPADANVDAVPPADAEPDAAPLVSTHEGTQTIVDLQVAGAPQYGEGIKIFFGWNEIQDETDVIIFDDRTDLGTGCAAWVYDLTADPPQLPPADDGHGPITITGTTDAIPVCDWDVDQYTCPTAVSGNGDNAAIGSAGAAGLFTFTDTDAAFTAADVAGRWLSITITDGDANNEPFHGEFPIVQLAAATTLVIVNTDPAADVVNGGPGVGHGAQAASTTYEVIAGKGMVPGYSGGIADDDSVGFALDSPAGDAIEDISITALDPGDSFSLPLAMQGLMNAVPIPDSGGTSQPISFDCARQVATTTGVGPAITVSGDDATLTDTGAFTAATGIRVGAEVTLDGLETTGNNGGPFTITAFTDDTITYTNANAAAESFDADSVYTVHDCGTTFASAVNMDFNDGSLTEILAYHPAGTGPSFVYTAGGGPGGTNLLTVMDVGNLKPGYFGDYLSVSGADAIDPDNNVTPDMAQVGMIIDATDNTVTVIIGAAEGTSGAFDANTTYAVIKKIGMGLPDRATATKVGAIQCASLLDEAIVIPAAAVDALKEVQPTLVQTTFVKSALGVAANADTTNETKVLVGHGFVGFTANP